MRISCSFLLFLFLALCCIADPGDTCLEAVTLTEPTKVYRKVKIPINLGGHLEGETGCGLEISTYWFKLTATSNYVITFETEYANFAEILSVASGSCDELTCIEREYNHGLDADIPLVTTSGTTYYIVVSRDFFTTEGDVTLTYQVSAFGPSYYDNILVWYEDSSDLAINYVTALYSFILIVRLFHN